jgi:hypothetical protein
MTATTKNTTTRTVRAANGRMRQRPEAGRQATIPSATASVAACVRVASGKRGNCWESWPMNVGSW